MTTEAIQSFIDVVIVWGYVIALYLFTNGYQKWRQKERLQLSQTEIERLR